MFAVLQLESEEGQFGLRRLWNDFGLSSPKVHRVETSFGDFFTIRTALSHKGVVWHKVAKAAGNQSGRLLLPKGIETPPGCGVTAYRDEEFLRRLLVNVFLEILDRLPVANRPSVLLVDPGGRCRGVAVELIQRVRSLRVLTANAGWYDACCLHCIGRYGETPTVAEDVRLLQSASVVLAPYGFYPLGLPSEENIIFAQGSGRIGMRVIPESVVLPQRYLAHLPAGLSPSIFAAALSESGRAPDLSTLLPAYLKQRDRKFSLSELIYKLST